MELQKYEPMKFIDGVKLIDLKLFHDDGGEFCEIARLLAFISCGEATTGPLYDGPEVLGDEWQINYSMIMPGVVKAFHIHLAQVDLWFIPPGNRALVILHDRRPKDPTLNMNGPLPTGANRMRIVMGVKPQLLVIPPGVAHGIKNIDTKPISMIYLVNRHFNPKDEYRLPYDYDKLTDWSIQNG